MAISTTTLNEAMCAYVQTVSNGTRLEAYLREADLVDQLDEITSALDAVLSTARDLLWKLENVTWDRDFASLYGKMLLERHSWLQSDALARVLAYSYWYAWHEGLSSAGNSAV